jgi:formiminotetrahydrofolate cyclodeaminase
VTLDTQPLDRFLDDVASERVAPAGGTATAVSGALGASLCEMACIHTLGTDPAPADLADVREDLRAERAHLLDLAAADAAVVDDLFAAADGPDDTTTKRAVGVPFTTAESCLTVLELASRVTADATRTAVADAATGVLLIDAAFRASVRTARHSLNRVTDPRFAVAIENRIVAAESRADDARDRAMRHVDVADR